MPRPILLALLSILGCVVVLSTGSPSKSQGVLLVANKGDQTLGIVDPDTGKQVATVGGLAWARQP